jgi:hypothetical protein
MEMRILINLLLTWQGSDANTGASDGRLSSETATSSSSRELVLYFMTIFSVTKLYTTDDRAISEWW